MMRPHDVGRLVGMTVALSWLDGEQAVTELAAIGFTAVEVHRLQIGPSIPGVPVLEAHAAALGALIEERGLVASSLNAAGAAGFEPITGDRNCSIDSLAQDLRLAAALGAARVICWDGRLGDTDPARAPAVLASVVEEARARSRLRDPPDVSVELHPFTFALAAGRVRETAEALREVGAGLCLDFCHFGVALGPGFAAELGPDVISGTNHVHLADSDCSTSELHVPLGGGLLDVEGVAALFQARPVALAWDLFGWPAARHAMRQGLPRYAQIVTSHRRSLETAA
jgi:sugar phosphate isomerase/epimerase